MLVLFIFVIPSKQVDYKYEICSGRSYSAMY